MTMTITTTVMGTITITATTTITGKSHIVTTSGCAGRLPARSANPARGSLAHRARFIHPEKDEKKPAVGGCQLPGSNLLSAC